jgi:hypothetical protein
MVVIGVGMVARTGRVIDLSATRLAVVSAAHLPQDDATPKIAGKLDSLLG